MAKEVTKEMKQLLVDLSSHDQDVIRVAGTNLAIALTLPLRKGLLPGPILDNIFERMNFDKHNNPRLPLDFVAPGTENEFIAWTHPGHGSIPRKIVESTYVTLSTYRTVASIDWRYEYMRDTNWDVMGRAREVMAAQFIKKQNDDAWQTILASAVDRNIIVYDSDAAAGQFTKRVLTLGKTYMRRNGGGNSTSLNRTILTDLYMSPENMDDMVNWNVDQISDITRDRMFSMPDGAPSEIYQVRIHDFDEFGVGQEYQNYTADILGATLPGSTTEFMVGLSQTPGISSFIMPVVEDVTIFFDDRNHREGTVGFYGWGEWGWAVLDNRKVLLLAN